MAENDDSWGKLPFDINTILNECPLLYFFIFYLNCRMKSQWNYLFQIMDWLPFQIVFPGRASELH